jgi:hypothetical protein
VQRRPPADIFFTWRLTPKTPCGHHVHGRHCHGSFVKNGWRFSKFSEKIRNVDPHFNNLYLGRIWIWRAHIGLVGKLGLRVTHNVLQRFWSDHLLEPNEAKNEPQKTSDDLERSMFRRQVQTYICVRPWGRVTFKFREMLRNASEVTLVPKNDFFS